MPLNIRPTGVAASTGSLDARRPPPGHRSAKGQFQRFSIFGAQLTPGHRRALGRADARRQSILGHQRHARFDIWPRRDGLRFAMRVSHFFHGGAGAPGTMARCGDARGSLSMRFRWQAAELGRCNGVNTVSISYRTDAHVV